MTIHYHGTPITPRSVLRSLAGHCFCVSFADIRDVEIAHQIGQSVMLDNGAFTFWRTGRTSDWYAFYRFAEQWLEYPTTWAIIPDFIDGGESENDRLLGEWPHGDRGAPVWHMHESLDRLSRLADAWPRICFGSSGRFKEVGSIAWRHQCDRAFNLLAGRGPLPWIHMLRGMSLSGSEYPFASVDSTDIARNHHEPTYPNALTMAQRWDSKQCPGQWTPREQLELEATADRPVPREE